MHVVLNALSINNRSGTGRYAWGLIHGFIKRRFADVTLSVLIPQGFQIPPLWQNENSVVFFSIAVSSTLQRILWEQRKMASFVNKLEADIFHCPAFIAPIFRKPKAKTIITIHDLAYHYHSETIPRLRRIYYQWAIKKSIGMADTIITDSVTVSSELRKLYALKQHIIPIELGVHCLRYQKESEKDDQEILKKYDIQTPYFLFVGTLEPRKNLSTILSAYQQALKQNIEADLIIVGREGWMQKNFTLPNKIKTLGYVDENHLPALYRHAKALLAPSLYEGFDLPTVEALSCGTPVIASDINVHREVLKDNAVYVSTTDTIDWRNALLQADQNKKRDILPYQRSWCDVVDEILVAYYSTYES